MVSITVYDYFLDCALAPQMVTLSIQFLCVANISATFSLFMCDAFAAINLCDCSILLNFSSIGTVCCHLNIFLIIEFWLQNNLANISIFFVLVVA